MTTSFEPRYSNSFALVIGVNDYKHAPPLRFAVSDARAVASLLTDSLGFPKDNVTLLVDEDATRSEVARLSFNFATHTNANDRVLIYFAGHGYTLPSRRGDVGFLVPYDGDTRVLSSLLRWDDLTHAADLFEAKHVLFLMDACYGGLAVTRSLPPGSMRFLKDMLLRPARQVLTAGKADEVVADTGGPLPDHSVFTGHLLEGLHGNAADGDGVLTANGLMAYVYQRVSRDPGSRQTPHFGHIDGDGDLIFAAPVLTRLQEDEQRDVDTLVSVPVAVATEADGAMTVLSSIKEFLADERHLISLHDLVANETRRALTATADDHFPSSGPWSDDEFRHRLKRYEDATALLCDIETLVGYWGRPQYQEILTLPAKRLSGRLAKRQDGGLVGWLGLSWYPILLFVYSGGISAIASHRYENLKAIMSSRVEMPDGSRSVLQTAASEVWRLNEAFKKLPGHERQFVPLSEYLFKLLQPRCDDLLFVGTDYELHFDTFEVMAALEFAEEYSRAGRDVWAPPGRFGYKYRSGQNAAPYQRVLAEAESSGEQWPPLRAGLFGGSYTRFSEVAAAYKENVLERLPWW